MKGTTFTMLKKLIAAAISVVSVTIVIYNSLDKNTQQTLPMENMVQHEFVSDVATRRNLAAGIHLMMGGELAMGESWVDTQNSNSFSFTSSPFTPREYTGTGTAFVHYKNATEKDADGETTFPPSKSPITQQYTGWFSPTDSPSRMPLSSLSSPSEPTKGPNRSPLNVSNHATTVSIVVMGQHAPIYGYINSPPLPQLTFVSFLS